MHRAAGLCHGAGLRDDLLFTRGARVRRGAQDVVEVLLVLLELWLFADIPVDGRLARCEDFRANPRRRRLQVGIGLERFLLHLQRAADARVFVVALRTVDVDPIGLHAKLFVLVDHCDEVRRRLAELALPLRQVRDRRGQVLLGRGPGGVVLEESAQVPFVVVRHFATFSGTGQRRHHQGGREHHGRQAISRHDEPCVVAGEAP